MEWGGGSSREPGAWAQGKMRGAELQELLEAEERGNFQHLVENFKMDKAKPNLD